MSIAYIITGFLLVLVGALGFFLCEFFWFKFVLGFFGGMSLFIWAFCLFVWMRLFFGRIYCLVFVCLFFFLFYFHCNILSLLVFQDELITSYWWGVVHCDLQFFSVTYKSSLAELQRSPDPSEILLLALKCKATCNHCNHRRFQGTSVAALYLLTSISPSCSEHWVAELWWGLSCSSGGLWVDDNNLESCSSHFCLGPLLLQLNLHLTILPALVSLGSLLCQPRDDKILDISKNTLISKNKAAVGNVKDSLDDNSFN